LAGDTHGGSGEVGEGGGRVVKQDNLYAWAKKWFILNTLATLAGALTGLAALVIAVIALTS